MASVLDIFLIGKRLCGGVRRCSILISGGVIGWLNGLSLGVDSVLREEGTNGAHSGLNAAFPFPFKTGVDGGPAGASA